MLQRQQIAVNFAQGLDTKSDPKQVQGKLLSLENGVFTSPGRIKKRNGYKKVASALAGAQKVASFKSELLAIDGSNLYSYSDATARWEDQGVCRSLRVTRDPVWHASTAQYPSSATIGGLTLTAYAYIPDTARSGVAAYSIRYSVKDQVTGQEIVSDKALATSGAFMCRVVAVGTSFIVFWVEAPAYQLYYSVIPSSNPSVPGTAQLVDSVSSTYFGMDAEAGSYATRAYVAWTTSTAIKAAYVTSAGVLSSLATIATEGVPATAIGMFIDSVTQGPVIGYAVYGGAVKYAGCTTALAVSYSATVETPTDPATASDASRVTQLIGYAASGVGAIYYSAYNTANAMWSGGPTGVWTRSAAISSGTVGAKATIQRGVKVWSKCLSYGGKQYFVACYPYGDKDGVASVYLLIDSDGAIVARIAQQDSYPWAHSSAWVPVDWLSVSTGVYQLPVSVASRSVRSKGKRAVIPGVDMAVVDFVNATNRYQTAVLGGVLNINGGMLMQYDGAAVVEQGFHYWPVGCNVAAATGTALTAGQYQYKIVYEWTDAQGSVHLSAPGPAATITVASPNFATTVTVPTLRSTAKSSVMIRVYRTTADGSVFYLLNGPLSGQSLVNDPTKDVLTYSDATSDASLASSLLLYTQSEVDNVAGPPADSLAVYRNRLMLTHSEDPLSVWYSKQVVPGTALAFNDTFIQNIDPTDGPVTAMGWLDDKVAIFKRNIIFYMTGTGPAPDGTANDFSTPIVINTNSGCVAPRSIVTADDGVMYQSAKGIYLLTRSLEDVYIGAGVEAYNAASVVESVMVPNTNEVRFALSTGQILVWDYFLKQWSVFTFASSPAIASATAYQNVTAYLSAGQVWQENPGVYLDDTVGYSLKAKTAWLQLAGLQGYQRAYKALILGDYASAHTLNVKVYVDFDDGTAVQTTAITPTSTKPYQYRLFLARQKCQAIQFELYDSDSVLPGTGSVMPAGMPLPLASPAETTPSQGGFDLSALSLEIGVKKGLRKMEAGRSY